MAHATSAPPLPSPASRSEIAISIRHLHKTYAGDSPAVGDLDIDIRRGEFVCLIGPSGCGKTTILKMINRLIEPTSGEIRIDGKDTASLRRVDLRRGIGYVIQQVGLFPHKTVGDNVASVLTLLNWSRSKRRSRAAEMLALVELDPETYVSRYPAQLSGGQRQRVGVARALAADPEVLLMDEPFSAIDPIARTNLQRAFLDIQRTVRKTIVMVTHDVDEALLLADRIAIFSNNGTLEQYDTPQRILANPANDFVTTFLGSDKGIRQLSVTNIPVDRLRRLPPAFGARLADAGGCTAEELDLLAGSALGALPPTAHEPLATGDAIPPAYRIGAAGTLRDALSRILQNRHDWLVVIDDATRVPLGLLDSATIHAVIRESVTSTAAEIDGTSDRSDVELELG
jgi:osmoprotectant transport system ATP-binding protein